MDKEKVLAILISIYGQELVNYIVDLNTIWLDSSNFDDLCTNIEASMQFK